MKSLVAYRARKIIARIKGLPDQPVDWQPLTPEDVETFRRLFPRPKFFIFGHARSGTTLLARLVRLHPEVHCNWQGRFVTHYGDLLDLLTARKVSDWLRHNSNHWGERISSEAILARAVIEFILESQALSAGKRVVGDKTPNLRNGEAVDRLHAVFPDAKLLFIVRDGRDTLVSLRLAEFINRPHQLSVKGKRLRREFFRNPDAFITGRRSIFTEEWLRRLALRWRENVLETHKKGQTHYGANFMALRYEELLVQPVRMMQRVWNFLDVDPGGVTDELVQSEMKHNPNVDYRNEAAGEAARCLPHGGPEAWKAFFTEADYREFMRIAGQVMQAWGYVES